MPTSWPTIEAQIEKIVAGRARVRPQFARARSGDGAPARLRRPDQSARGAAAARRSARRATQGWLEAVRDGIAEEMRANPAILYFGEGTGERGGSFAHTKNLWQEFGAERMVDTPISEQGFTAAAVGASATGARTVSDLMFADFAFETAGQIFLQAAKLRYMSNGQMSAPMVVRVGAGALRSSGPHHSGIYHPVFAHMPGLIVCVPSTPADAKGLMKTALRAGDPVIMLEPKALFASQGRGAGRRALCAVRRRRASRAPAPTSPSSPPARWCSARWKRPKLLAAEGIECEVIDLRTIMPLDVDTIVASVRKTHRLLVVDEAWAMCGMGGEIAQAINELAFDELDAPAGPAAHRADLASLRAGARARHAGRRAAHRRTACATSSPARRRCRITGIHRPRPAKRRAGCAGACRRSSRSPPRQPRAAAPAGDDEPITMPFGDLTVSEGKVVKWLKAVGDAVKEGEVVAEIETDKAVVEIEAPVAGTLGAIEQPVGAVVPMGGRIGGIKK